jgi:hypothetical protein
MAKAEHLLKHLDQTLFSKAFRGELVGYNATWVTA